MPHVGHSVMYCWRCKSVITPPCPCADHSPRVTQWGFCSNCSTRLHIENMLDRIFSNQEDIYKWLDSPHLSLGGRTPGLVMEEDGGADAVHTLLKLALDGGGGL